LVRKRFELGEVTRTDLEQAKSRLSAMQSSKIQADGNLVVSKAVYKKVFGVEAKDLTIPDKMPNVPADFDDFKKISKVGNIDIQISEISKKIAKFDIARSVGNLLPSVSASISVVKNDDYYLSQGIKETKAYGVDLSIPIIPRGGSEYTKILQSKYAYNRYSYDYANAELVLEQQILEAWNNLKTNEANLKTAQSTLEFTTLAMNAVKKEAEYGSRTTLDVLNAELENFNASVNLIKVRYTRVLSYYKLIAIIGKLDKSIFNI
jgi:outer membrane protein TolC